LAGGYSAEAGEVKVDGDGVTLRGSDVNGRRARGKEVGGKVEFESCPSQIARIAVAPAIVVGLAVKVGGGKGMVVIRDPDLKVPPEILGPRDKGFL
jgi:hypothetical protein